MSLLPALQSARIVPVVVLNKAEDALPLAQALLAGGMKVIEITFRTEAAPKAIALIAQNEPDFLIGAGTLLTREQVLAAQKAGAHFGVSPGLDEDIVRFAQEISFPLLPGIATASELTLAIKLACPVAKFFPAKQAGGPEMIKALLGAFRHTGIRFMPTGGIDAQSVSDYLAIPEVVAAGGSWMVEGSLIQEKNWTEITRRATEALSQVAPR